MIILRQKEFSDTKGVMIIEDVFSIIGRGIIATGKVDSGVFKVNDTVEIYDESGNNKIESTIKELQVFRKIVDKVSKGENVGILLDGVKKNEIKRNMTIKVK